MERERVPTRLRAREGSLASVCGKSVRATWPGQAQCCLGHTCGPRAQVPEMLRVLHTPTPSHAPACAGCPCSSRCPTVFVALSPPPVGPSAGPPRVQRPRDPAGRLRCSANSHRSPVGPAPRCYRPCGRWAGPGSVPLPRGLPLGPHFSVCVHFLGEPGAARSPRLCPPRCTQAAPAANTGVPDCRVPLTPPGAGNPASHVVRHTRGHTRASCWLSLSSRGRHSCPSPAWGHVLSLRACPPSPWRGKRRFRPVHGPQRRAPVCLLAEAVFDATS